MKFYLEIRDRNTGMDMTPDTPKLYGNPLTAFFAAWKLNHKRYLIQIRAWETNAKTMRPVR